MTLSDLSCPTLLFGSAVFAPPDESSASGGASETTEVGGPASSSPSSAPAEPSPSISRQADDPDDSGSDEFNFPDELESDDDSSFSAPVEGTPAAEPSAPVPAQASTKTTQPQKPTEPTAAAPTVQTPASPSGQQQAPAVQQPGDGQKTSQTEAPSSSAEPKKSLLQLIDEGRTALEQNLAETRFKLDQADTEALEQGDPTVVPKLLARAHVESMRSMAEMFEQVVPQMVVQAIQVQRLQTAADDEFYGGNQDLLAHREQIVALAKTLRQLHPAMSKAEFIPLLANSARTVLGLGAVVAPSPAAAPAPAPNGHSPATAPHQPVVSSVPQSFSQPTRVDPNDWGAVDHMFDQET